MEAEQNASQPNGATFTGTTEGVKGICTIPARLSGCFSLIIQAICWFICIVIVTLFFFHIGGFRLVGNGIFNAGINRTTEVESDITPAFTEINTEDSAFGDTDNGNRDKRAANAENGNNKKKNGKGKHQDEQQEKHEEAFPTPMDFDTNGNKSVDDETSTSTESSIQKGKSNAKQASHNDKNNKQQDGNDTEQEHVDDAGDVSPDPEPETLPDIKHNTTATTMTSTELSANDVTEPYLEKVYEGPFQQIRPVLLHIGRLEIELLEVLRSSCVVFLSLCLVWFVAIVCLAMSLYYEILDLVYINIFVLSIISAYTFVKALLIGILIFYQTNFDWATLFLISGTVGLLLVCFIFLVCAMILMIVWYRYIDYMNGGNETCLCTSTIAELVKSRGRQAGTRGGREQPAAEYTIPEATRHANLPYIDEPAVHQFSNF